MPRMICTPAGVLGEADGVDHAADLVGGAGGPELVGDGEELVHRDPGDLRHHLRRVAGVVVLQLLEDAPWILQRGVDAGERRPGRRRALGQSGVGGVLALGRRLALVVPHRRVVAALRLVVAGEQAVVELEVLGDEERRVRVQLDVVLVVQLVLEHVVDQTAEEGDIGPGADRGEHVGDRRRPREARVDVDDPRSPLVSPDVGPLPPARVVLGGVGPDDQDAVAVLEVAPVVRHRPTAEAGGQTGHRGTVSNSGLLFDVDDPQGADQLGGEVALLAADRRPAQEGEARRCG